MLKDTAFLRQAALVGADWVEAGDGAIEVKHPATGALIGRVPNLGKAETLAAIDAAEAAQVDCAARTAKERAVILRRWYDLMVEHADDLACILTMEQGKPLAKARGEILYGASFIEWFSEKVRRVCATVFGPLTDSVAVAEVEEHIADAAAHGAAVALGGKLHAPGGTFFEPTVLTGVTQDMAIAPEETFGPVAPVFRFETDDEVVAMSNDTEFGLASYFHTRDLARAWRVGKRLAYGMVGINTGLISTAEAPFGGIKSSGLGRDSSRYGIEEFLEIKYLCFGGIA